MVDFANKNIGGGILRNGAVQEEIMFSVFPELIISLCICPELNDDESLIFYDALRFNNYKGYSKEFKYVGNFSG